MLIHITGASGSGTSTLGAALAAELGGMHLDADDYYWLPTSPPFTHKRPAPERLALLLADLRSNPTCVLAGSVVGWGDALEDAFDLVVFLYLDAAIRVERLRRRETEQLGHADPVFLEWAAQYDAGPPVGRSLAKHRAWLARRRCRVLELHGDLSVGERVTAVLQERRADSFTMPPALRGRLEAMYGEPHRRYHTLVHIEALLGWHAHWRALARAPRLIEAAIWFHDAVYDTHRDDNEPRSAELARDELRALAWPEAAVARVTAMVRATRHHAADLSDADTLLFLDLDLSVLAQRADVYDAYSVAVRAEYAWVEAQRYRAGRLRVLQSFMTRDAIYRTPALHAAWESAARANLARELQGLTDHTG